MYHRVYTTVRYPERAGDFPLKRAPALAAVTILYDCAPVKNCALSNVVVPVTVSKAYPLAPPAFAALTVVPLTRCPHALLNRINDISLPVGEGRRRYQVLTAELINEAASSHACWRRRGQDRLRQPEPERVSARPGRSR